MPNIKQVQRTVDSTLEQYEPKQPVYPALIGDGNGNVEVSGRPGYVYVRVGNEKSLGQAFNGRVPNRNDLPVTVGYDRTAPDLFQVLTVRQVYVQAGLPVVPEVPSHHETHEWPSVGDSDSDGSDVVFVDWRQVRNLRVSVDSGLTVLVESAPAYVNGAWAFITEQSLNLSSYKPDSGARYVLVYLDDTGTIAARAGSVTTKAALDISDCPVPQSDELPLAGVALYSGQTTISDDRDRQDIIDLRWWPQVQEASTNNLQDIARVAGEMDLRLTRHIVEG